MNCTGMLNACVWDIAKAPSTELQTHHREQMIVMAQLNYFGPLSIMQATSKAVGAKLRAKEAEPGWNKLSVVVDRST